MPVADQPVTSYDSTWNDARYTVISDVRSLIDPADTPLLDLLGLNSANSRFRFQDGPGKKIVWLEDSYRTLTATLAATASSSATSLTLSDASLVKKGDILTIDNEKVWVSADPDLTGNTITVARGFAGTTAATHGTGTITIDTWASLEGDTWRLGPLQTPSTNYNFIQAFELTVRVTDIQNAMPMRGAQSGELEYQVDKAMPELMRALERAILRNVGRVDSSASAPPVLGGLPVFVTTNTLSTAASALTLTNLESVGLSCYNAGGTPDTLLVSPDVMPTLRKLTDQYLQWPPTTTSIGNVIENVIMPWGHKYRIVVDRHLPSGKIYFLDLDHLGVYEFKPFATFDHPKTGSFEARTVIGYYSFVVRHDKAHGVVTLT